METPVQQASGRATLDEVLVKLRTHLPRLREKFNVKSLRVFGSYARGGQQAESDLDIIVEYSRMPGLFAFGELEDTLTDLLGIKVDLTMEDTMRPRARQTALRDAIPV